MTAMLPETRCVHGMLEFHVRVEYENGVSHTVQKSSCSICRGLPYTVADVLVEFDPVLADGDTGPVVWWLPLEERTECAACGKPLDRGQPAAWVQAYEGPVGRCCLDAVAS